jgi:biopolymer transport protein TolR
MSQALAPNGFSIKQNCRKREVTMLKHIPSHKLSAEINVTPMADIMLVLLIIFMITTPILQNDVSLNLPRAQNPLDVQTTEQLVLSLTRDGKLYMGKTRVSEQEMAKALSELVANELNKNIFLRADQALPYGDVVHLVNEVRSLGVDRMGLMTEKEIQSFAR